MTHGTQRATRIGLITLLGLLLAVGVFVPGCAPDDPVELVEPADDIDIDIEDEPDIDEPEPEPQVDEPEDAPEPVAAAIGEEGAHMMQQIEQCNRLTELLKLKKEYQKEEARNEEIDEAFASRQRQLLAESEVMSFNDDLHLVDFEWSLIESSPEREDGRKTYQISWVLHKTGDIVVPEDRRAILLLMGRPDEAHEHLVPPLRGTGPREVESRVEINPQDWPLDSLQLVTSSIPGVELPYEMRTWVNFETYPGEVEQMQYDRQGDVVHLGWVADLGS